MNYYNGEYLLNTDKLHRGGGITMFIHKTE